MSLLKGKDANTVFLYEWLKDWLKVVLCLLLISCGIYLSLIGYGRGLYVYRGVEYVPESTFETYQHRSYLYDGHRRICEVERLVLFSPTGKFVIFNGPQGIELFSRKSGRVPVATDATNMVLQSCSWDESNNQATITIFRPSFGDSSARKRVIRLP